MGKMNYRSLSFHAVGGIPDPALVRRGAELGFNDITFRTEGRTVSELEGMKKRGDQEGYFALADELDMSISIWTHEIEDYDPQWGPVAVENDRLWEELASRYEYVLGELFPELDHLALTVTETYCWITDPQLLKKLVESLNEVCRDNDAELILRSFIWHPQQLEDVRETILTLPEDVSVMTKAVPNDWHFRSIHHPLIGDIGERTEYVEQDLANEYARRDFTAGCNTDILEEQFDYWERNDVDGFNLRVARYVPEGGGQMVSRPYTAGEFMQADILGHPNEANLWAVGYLSQGKSVEQAWDDFATYYFGDPAAGEMIKALKPTGEILNEGLCVDALHFGRTNWNGNRMTDRGGTPGHRSMLSRYLGTIKARPHTEEEALNHLYSNPFAQRPARWRFDESYVHTYHRIRKGHPDIIKEKEAAYRDALRKVERSLELIDSVEEELPEGAHEYFRFKVEENKFHLQAMSEAQLAWLKANNRLYYSGSNAVYYQEEVFGDIKQHLAKLEELIPRYEEEATVEWAGRQHNLKRGPYIDIVRYLHEFRQYWDLDTSEMYSKTFS